MPPCIRFYDMMYIIYFRIWNLSISGDLKTAPFLPLFWQLAASKGPLSDSFWRRRQSSCFGCRRARVSNAGRSCFWSQVGLLEYDGAFPEVHTMLSLFQYRLFMNWWSRILKILAWGFYPYRSQFLKPGLQIMHAKKHDTANALQSRKSMANLGWPALESLAASMWFAKNVYLGGGFKHFLFLPLPGEMIQFD